MKTFNLFIACSAIALNAMAVEWPEEWAISGTVWFSGEAIGSVTQKEATATYLGSSYDIYAADFIYSWEDELKEDAAPIAIHDGASTVKPNDGVGEWKAGYDDSYLYVFVQYADDEIPMGTEKVEIALAPYDKLETSMLDQFQSAGVEGLLYARWTELGGLKITSDRTGQMTVMEASGELKTAADNPYSGTAAADAIFMDCTDQIGNPSLIQWIVAIPFTALDDIYNNVPFDLDVWESACNGKGISFDVKFADSDMDGVGRNYWWNANDNNGFWSTSYSGYLAKGDPEDAIDNDIQKDAVSNMKITATQIQLNEPVDVKILNASGMLIKSVNNAVNISITELPVGTYIVVAGNETDTFVK